MDFFMALVVPLPRSTLFSFAPARLLLSASSLFGLVELLDTFFLLLGGLILDEFGRGRRYKGVKLISEVLWHLWAHRSVTCLVQDNFNVLCLWTRFACSHDYALWWGRIVRLKGRAAAEFSYPYITQIHNVPTSWFHRTPTLEPMFCLWGRGVKLSYWAYWHSGVFLLLSKDYIGYLQAKYLAPWTRAPWEGDLHIFPSDWYALELSKPFTCCRAVLRAF